MRRISIAVLTAVIALAAVSCMVDVEVLDKPETIIEQGMILEATIASTDPETKTVRQSDNKVFWAPGDAISLFYGSGDNGGNKFTALCTEPVAVTNFTGNIGVITGGGEISMDQTYFWGVYPYSDSTSCNGSSITTILPAQQKTAAGSFGNGQFPTLGRSLGLTMSFYNICGGIRFTVVHDDIRSVEFKSLSGSSIAGVMNVTLDSNGLPLISSIDGSDTIVVTPEDGKTFVPGTTYFAVIPPTVMSGGLEVTYKTLTTKATKTFASSITITRSVFSGLTAQDNGLTFELRDDNVPFEDDNFKAYCVANFDTDRDGEISITEAQDVITVDCNNKNISSLEGIEYFTALRILYCDSNQLTSLDVSNNSALIWLHCFSNQLTSLDVSNNTSLTDLFCYSNQLVTLDLRDNVALEYLWCNSNQLSSLDVSNNTALTNLICYSNQLTSLDVSRNIALNSLSCFSNQLISLDLSNNAALKNLWCHSNQIASLDVSNNTALTNLDCSPMGTLDTLYIAQDQPIPHITENRSNDYIPEQTEIVVVGQAIDLSASGTANCYIVSENGTYKFKTVQGNTNTSVGDIKGVKVLWESFGTNVAPAVGDLIKPEVTYADNYITFSTNNSYKKGNAVIAAYSDADCTDGNVLWSWHIWLTNQPVEQIYFNNAGIMMDRNLGATSAIPGDVCALGLLYEFGRKDPFLNNQSVSTGIWPEGISSDANVGTVEYSVANPMQKIYFDWRTYDWISSSVGSSKGFWFPESTNAAKYNPCPAGWFVPMGGEDGIWATAFGKSDINDFSNADYDNNNNGYDFGKNATEKLGDYVTIWYPFYDTSGGSCWAGGGGKPSDNSPVFSYSPWSISSHGVTIYQSTPRFVRCQKKE